MGAAVQVGSNGAASAPPHSCLIPPQHGSVDVASLVRRAARVYPRRTAISWEDGARSYAELATRIDSLAASLVEMGVSHGDRVGLALGNGPDFVESYLATAQLGAIAVPLNPRQSGREYDHVFADAEPFLVIADAAAAPTLSQAKGLATTRLLACGKALPNGIDYESAIAQGMDKQPPRPLIALEAPVALLYTSGTTGVPKGVVRSQLAVSMIVALRQSAMSIGPDTVLLASTPMFHAAGHEFMLLQTLAAGGMVVSRRAFDPAEVVALVDRYHVTHVFFVPTMSAAVVQALLAAGSTWPGVRMWMSAAAPLPDWLRDAILKAAPGIGLWNCYGFTEGGTIAYLRPGEARNRPRACVGRPGPGMEVRVVDPEGSDVGVGEIGEIVCRSPESMTGYWRAPELTAQAVREGWVHSGDLGFLDEDGFLTLAGRSKDVVITGGETVYAAEVEAFLLEDRAIREVAVVGKAHPRWGEAVVAVVVPTEVNSDPCPALEARARKGLAPAKRPKRYIVRSALPRNSMGKVRKDALRNELAVLFEPGDRLPSR